MKKPITCVMVIFIVATVVFGGSISLVATDKSIYNTTDFFEKSNDQTMAFLPSSLNISIPNVDISRLRDVRPLNTCEGEALIRFGLTKQEISKMCIQDMLDYISKQTISDDLMDYIEITFPNIDKAGKGTWTYGEYDDYVYHNVLEINRESGSTITEMKKRGITEEDFRYLHKFYDSSDAILAQDDIALAQLLSDWYEWKLAYANAIMQTTVNNSQTRHDPSLYVTISAFANYNYVNDQFLRSVNSHISSYRIVQENMALTIYNRVYSLSSSNSSASFNNLYGTYSTTHDGAHEGIDMTYGASSNVYSIVSGTALCVNDTYNGIRVRNTLYGDAIYAI